MVSESALTLKLGWVTDIWLIPWSLDCGLPWWLCVTVPCVSCTRLEDSGEALSSPVVHSDLMSNCSTCISLFESFFCH